MATRTIARISRNLDKAERWESNLDTLKIRGGGGES